MNALNAAVLAPSSSSLVPLMKTVASTLPGGLPGKLTAPLRNANKFARSAAHPDFKLRHGLDALRLTELFAWTGPEFDQRMRGSAIYRIGYERWSRNIAVALGNAPTAPDVIAALRSRLSDSSALVREHVEWALAQHSATRALSA